MKQFKIGDVVVFESVTLPKEVITLTSFDPNSGRWYVEETESHYLQCYLRPITKLDGVLK